ncbi:flagellin [Bacillus cereus]|uniref:flagellin N-terminal helical domain-containing protein n=1 Tax=Bacillus nitratireducens TaxID=2026193 RepID=UPI000BECB85F|nr:flagellin [Bacillus nitratireducens]PEA28615.1 flagellin [Bacillus cereus]MED0902199.1 flagellin [Bacillus nitratireducens]PEE17540.1 flagellin [Bacillus cereus]PFH84074.1 flagellin [Bacillus cereus]PFK29677.1 flagellin [Bacillus cereus]
MRINTNINSMRTQEYMRQNQDKMNVSMNRLSSGKRINSAADDAAGLAIATRMRAKENGLGVASRNTQDGISMIRTADSAMNSVSNILLRMRDLAVQSANGTNTNENRGALEKEFSALRDQIDYISTNTQFNGKTLLNGDNKSIKIHSYDDGQAKTDANTSANPGTTNPGTTNPAINGTIDITLANVTSANLEGNEKKLSQISISATNAGTTGTAAAPAATGDDSTAITNANDAIKAIDGMIASIAGSRADLGATLNRLDFNVESLNNQASNMASSASQIEDADMAKEMSEMTKFKILNEAGISMLSQANQTPQMVSKLLQ